MMIDYNEDHKDTIDTSAFRIIKEYAKTFTLLNQYDCRYIDILRIKQTENIVYEITYEDAIAAIQQLKSHLIKFKLDDWFNLFGKERDGGFKSIIANVLQTFGDEYLYPSIEEQAANLMYGIIKNHPFSDGNKRLGAFMLVWLLEKNEYRFKPNGEIKLNDNALTALAILVAQSNPDDKDSIIQLIVSLISNS